MSSNLRIIKICAYCKQEFIAKKTTTETCSDPCAKRFYKIKRREKAIQRVKLETMVKREPKAFITEGEIKAVQAKEWLTLVEASVPIECVAFDPEAVGVGGKGELEEGGEEACV